MLNRTLLLLEELGRVAQPQLELYRSPPPRTNENDEVVKKIKFLKTRLFNVAEVNWQSFYFSLLSIGRQERRRDISVPISAVTLPRVDRPSNLVTMKLHSITPRIIGSPGLGGENGVRSVKNDRGMLRVSVRVTPENARR